MLELRSRILGLTALNAQLTRKIQSGVDETAAIKALESRNKELQQQLTACNKEISGLQVCFLASFSLHCILTLSIWKHIWLCPDIQVLSTSSIARPKPDATFQTLLVATTLPYNRACSRQHDKLYV